MNQTLEQMDQTDIYKTFHPIVAEYILLRLTESPGIDHMIGCKQTLANIIPAVLWAEWYEVEIYKRKAVKPTNMWKLNNTFLNNQWAEEEIKKEN